MTDEQIVKALPTVAYGGHSCNECKYKHEKGECRCGLKGCRITREALDLINRKDAEIEQRKAEKVKLHTLIPKMLVEAKSEAYKEFAERLCKDRVSNDPVVIAVKVELEELTEGGNEDGMD